MSLSRSGILFVLGGVAVTGCSNTPVAPPAPAAAAPVVAPAPAPAKPAATATPAPASTLPPYLDPKNPLASKRSVYFDFDVFSVKPEYTDLLALHGKYLAAHPGVAVKVEGNADERGSHEYNLALGQKRAQAVTQALKIYGVKENQVEAISWGEERPKSSEHDEEGWSENRRADLVYPTK